MTVEHSLIAKFKEWNTLLFRNDMFYDRRMVELLLMTGHDSKSIANGNISRKYLKFVSGKLSCIGVNNSFVSNSIDTNQFNALLLVFLRGRVGGDEHRLAKLEEYVTDFVKVKRKQINRQK